MTLGKATCGQAPLMTVVSASGGVGKSTLSLMGAWLAAGAGISTALVEADLQFGDFGYWLGLDDEVPDLGSGMACEPVHLMSSLALYKAPALPEVAEAVADDVVHLVEGLRRAYDLVIVDTGAFWSGPTAELVLAASLVFNVMDTRPSSVMGAVRAGELCTRIGAPSSRCVNIYNRYSGKARLSEREVREVFGDEEVRCVADGRGNVDAMLSSGAVDELVSSGNAMVRDVDALLSATLPRVGVLYAGTTIRRRGGLR